MPYLDDVAEFLVNGPLYVAKEVNATFSLLVPVNHSWDQVLPMTVSRECEKCKVETKWERRTQNIQGDRPESGRFYEVLYVCRNCGNVVFRCYLHWARDDQTKRRFSYLKVGQFPKFEISPPKDLEKALSSAEVKLYKSGKTLRHHGYGIGAMPYFRRLVEDTTHEMLDLLVEALEAEPDGKAAIAKIEAAKADRVFEEKVKLAGDLLPAHLRPGGVNPFHVIYDAVSVGLHSRSDDECCAIVDKLDGALTFVYRELKVHAKERREFAKSLKALVPVSKPRTTSP